MGCSNANGSVKLEVQPSSAQIDISSVIPSRHIHAVAGESMQEGLWTVDTAGANMILPGTRAGKFYYVTNASAQTITFKVTGQTGVAVASGKYALFVGTATDITKVYGN